MKAHVLENNVIVNTIEVESLDIIPGLVLATASEGIGWKLENGEWVAPATVVTVPQEVTMRQARLALLDAGLLANVQPAINSLNEPGKTKAQIEWEYSNALQRSNPFVTVLGTALGLDSEALDNLFITAAKL